MRHLLVFGMILTVLSVPVTAADMNITKSGEIEDVNDIVDQYNTYSDRVPDSIANVVGGERINVNITGNNSSVVYGMAMDGLKISNITEGGVDRPTLRIHTTTDTVFDIATADNPQQRAVDAFNSDEIQYEAVGWTTKIKFGVTSLIVKLRSLF